ncbi:MAG: flagellar hook-associated protein FlgK [Simplicispira sp.]|nr:flagellar hook-associated protein FlgK [Simplicispira sp.]
MSLLNVGARALLTNQVGLQTTGHNIANVNTPGYSRQSVSLQTVVGRHTGSGYIGQGVDVQSILRSHSDLLTRQATAAAATQAGDSVRMDRLSQLQDVFSGGAAGLGGAINDMMNAFSGVANAPTDMTARNVALTRMEETAQRLRGSADRLDEIGLSVNDQLHDSMAQINLLAKNIAGLNAQIVEARGKGQSPNDLLDQRDQEIRQLNGHIQTTQIAADDGSVSVFVAASQPLVMGPMAAQLSLGEPDALAPGSGQQRVFFSLPGATQRIELNESMLGGGMVTGLLRFKNNDLAEGHQLLGRLAVGISETLNKQNTLGLTLDGKSGQNLFAPIVLANAVPGKNNPSGTAAKMGMTVTDPSKLQASSYNISFDGPNKGSVTRQSDGTVFTFTGITGTSVPGNPPTLEEVMGGEGLKLTNGAPLPLPPATPPAFAGGVDKDQYVMSPMGGVAAQMQAVQYSPRALAAANPVNAAMGSTNGGSLQLASLKATGPTLTLPPSPLPPATTGAGVKITFTAGPPATFSPAGNINPPMNLSTTPPTALTAPFAYIPGQPISIDGWQITLQGSPKTGDTITVGNAADPQYGDWYTRDASNASAMVGLREAKIFDGAALSDGFAGAMAQIGTRTQSAQFAAQLSKSIADNLEQDRTALSGVNLDEEAARLLQYQQAYQASAKMLSIAQNIFDNLMQSVGR